MFSKLPRTGQSINSDRFSWPANDYGRQGWLYDQVESNHQQRDKKTLVLLWFGVVGLRFNKIPSQNNRELSNMASKIAVVYFYSFRTNSHIESRIQTQFQLFLVLRNQTAGQRN